MVEFETFVGKLPSRLKCRVGAKHADPGAKIHFFVRECNPRSTKEYLFLSSFLWNILISSVRDPRFPAGPRNMLAPMATPALSGMVAAVSACPQPMCALRSRERTVPNAARVLGCSMRMPSDLSTNTSRPLLRAMAARDRRRASTDCSAALA